MSTHLYTDYAFIKPGQGPRNEEEGLIHYHVFAHESRGVQFVGTAMPTVQIPDYGQANVYAMNITTITQSGGWWDKVSTVLPGSVANDDTQCWWIDLKFTRPGQYEVIIDGRHVVQVDVYPIAAPQYPRLTMTLGVNPGAPQVDEAVRDYIESFGPDYVDRDGWLRWYSDVNDMLVSARCAPYFPHYAQWWGGHNPATFYNGMGEDFGNPPGRISVPDPFDRELSQFTTMLWWNLTHGNLHWRPNQIRMGDKNINEMTVNEVAWYAASLADYQADLVTRFGHPVRLVPNFDEPGDPNAYTAAEDPEVFERIEKIVQGFAQGGRPASMSSWNIDSVDRYLGPPHDIISHFGEIMFSQSEKRRRFTLADKQKYSEMGVKLQSYLVYHGLVAVDGVHINSRQAPNQMLKDADTFAIESYEDNITRSLYWQIASVSSGANWQDQTRWMDGDGVSARLFRLRRGMFFNEALHEAEEKIGRLGVLHHLENTWQGLHYEDIRGQLLAIATEGEAPPPPPAPLPPETEGKYLQSASSDLPGYVRVVWDAVPNATHYTLWRNTNPDDPSSGVWTSIRNITATVYNDAEVIPLRAYLYRVDAGNATDSRALDPDRIGVAQLPEDLPTDPDPTPEPPESPPGDYEAAVLAELDKINHTLETSAQSLADLVEHLGADD